MAKNDGGPAFPGKHTWIEPDMVDPSTGDTLTYTHEVADASGMSLRDWFAGQALAGMVADHESKTEQAMHGRDHGILLVEVIAKAAYSMADAMIAERDK